VRRYSREEWEKVRSRGRKAFLLRAGFLGRGLPMGLLTAVAIQVYLGLPLPDSLWSAPFLERLALAVGVFTASGCVAAHSNWSLHERLYQGRA